MSRLDELRTMRSRIDLEIEREEAYQRRMTALRRDYGRKTDRDAWTLRIIHATAAHYDTTPEALIGTSKKADVTEARHIACWLLWEAGRTYSEIGRHIDRDHTTAMYAVRRVTSTPGLLVTARDIQGHLHGEREAS